MSLDYRISKFMPINFFNLCLEIASLKKLNVVDSSNNYLSKLLGVHSKSLIHLKDVIVSVDTIDHVESSIEEAISRHRWTDVSVRSENFLINDFYQLFILNFSRIFRFL